MTLSREVLSGLIRELDTSISAWLAEDAQRRSDWFDAKKLGTPAAAVLPAAIAAGLTELFTVTSTADVEVDAQTITFAVDAFRAEYLQWWVIHDMMRPGDIRQSLSQWGTVLKTLEPPPPRKLPRPIKEMVRQAIPVLAIAKNFAWYTEGGKPDTQRVREEIEQPGRHYDPATWAHPSEARAKRAAAERWAARIVPTPPAEPDAKPVTTPRPARVPCSQTTLELCALPGIKPAAVAAKRCIALSELETELDQHGLTLSAVGQPLAANTLKRLRDPQGAARDELSEATP